MAFIKTNIIFPVCFILAVVLFADCQPSHAFEKEVSGKNAENLITLFQSMPYISVGTGEKVVYVYGRPRCGLTQQFYYLTQSLYNQYEFRWLLQPHVKQKFDSIGMYEKRTPEVLQAVLGDGEPAPATDKNKAMELGILVAFLSEATVGAVGHLESHQFPVIAFETDAGATYLSSNKGFFDRPTLLKILAPAKPETKNMAYDTDALLSATSSAVPGKGDFCSGNASVPINVFPINDSPTYFSLEPRRCLEIRAVMTIEGEKWNALNIYGDKNTPAGYAKAK